ncbi:hypothetical protein D9613_004570 [Agrocybe pediades]|uniref:F-box domain-containing protein n=1 Tax=Agrocybe pediades TaxID=84607 RepID=A0A8H4QIN2_9AGAR|nr:hypothetical protein D9613_004570 [Agrocybe pediades]
MNHHHSSVVSKLPPEILSTIFEVYTSDALPPSLQDEIQFQFPQHNILPIPLVLSHVCHRWRQVAFSTPQIWTTFTISLDRCNGSPAEQDIIYAWISRTRNHPLTIHLRSSLEEDYCTGALPKSSHLPVLQVLASSFRQWHHFSARVPTYVLEYLGNQVEDIPLIDTVGIRVQALPLQMPLDTPITNQLWKAVTTMRIEHISTDECVTLISSTPNLVTCVFHDIDTGGDEVSWHSTQRVVEHPKLQYLTYDSCECCHIFYRLKLSNLKSMICVSKLFLEEDWSTILPVFFANSGLEKLEVLTLPSDTFTSDQLESLLSMTPTITHFSLICTGDYVEVVNGLLEHLERTAVINSSQFPRAFLPNLTSLEFEVHEPYFPWEKVAPCFAHVLVPNSATEFKYRPLSTGTNTNAITGGLILPNLRVLEISSGTKNFPWKLVPKCFGIGPLPDGTPERNIFRRRPLSIFRVINNTTSENSEVDGTSQHLIPPDILKELIALKHEGVEIVFRHEDGEDLLARSMVDAGLDYAI